MAKTNPNDVIRQKRIKRIRKKISGSLTCPRLRVFKSTKHIYAQIIDDVAGRTLAAMSTLDSAFKDEQSKGKMAQAHKVGVLLAEKAKLNGVEKVVFDRGGYLYHGRVKSLSEGAREAGLIF
ncbi:MAG: 50S ribosomal protein L18 [Desulfobulbaceae bacterium]|nr:50S ribosomal protein L18 [Desulfobulbaceae bacterium]